MCIRQITSNCVNCLCVVASAMSGTNNLDENQIDCVLISDEDDDDIQETTATMAAASMKPTASRPAEMRVYSDDTNVSFDEMDGRRVSRRRRNRNTDTTDGRSNGSGNDHIENYKPNASTSAIKEEKKFVTQENRETRSRKRERSPSTGPVDMKENESVTYKEILSGLEGAAFQSRCVIDESIFDWNLLQIYERIFC